MRHFILRFMLALAILPGLACVPATADGSPSRVSAVYLDAYHLANQWQAYFDVPAAAMFNTNGNLSSSLVAALNQVAQDAQNMGFNTVVLTPFYYPVVNSGPLASSAPGTIVPPSSWVVSLPYTCLLASSTCSAGTGFVELATTTFAAHGLSTYVGLAPQNQLTDNTDTNDWVTTCEDPGASNPALSAWNEAQVRHYALLPGVKGVLCAFESWGTLSDEYPPVNNQPSQQLTTIESYVGTLKTYANSKGAYYLNVPASGLMPPASSVNYVPVNSFGLISQQLNPKLYYNAQTMASVFSSSSQAPQDGIEMNAWSGSLLVSPLNASMSDPQPAVAEASTNVPNEAIVDAWQNLQYEAVLKYRPNILTWEDYTEIAFPSLSWENLYGSRGWAMSANAMMDDPTLAFYDPMESSDSTVVIGGIADPNVDYVVDGCDASGPGGVQEPKFGGGGAARIETGQAITYPLSQTPPFISSATGTLSLWVRPLLMTGVTAVKSHVLAAACTSNYTDNYVGPLGTDTLGYAGAANGPDCMLLQLTNSNLLTFTIADSSGREPTVYYNAASWAGTQTWHHVAAAWNANVKPQQLPTIQLYVDGTLVPAADGVGSIAANWALSTSLGPQFVVGNRWDTGSYAADADIDDVRVYNAALSAAQIEQLYSTFLAKGNVANPSCPSVSM